ncbi:fumarylacetoacetate hydrolase family protein [Streptomyces sp. NPDC047453]|uniref:2-keto-4-pentenoate hydratase n=1 Tax=Streptomyces sp. NPDC047453 TaxID=3154812 RepID=UPI0033D102A6
MTDTRKVPRAAAAQDVRREAGAQQVSRGVAEAAARLLKATATGVPCVPVRDLIGTSDTGAAYAVQQQVTAARLARGARVAGHKIGLTSPAVQHQLSVDQPDFGVLLDDMGYADGNTVPYASVLQPRVEAEIAFVLGADLAEGPLDLARVRAAVDHAVAALEICGSRIAGWDITLSDTVADNASAGAFVLGRERRSLAEFEPRTAVMEMSVDGRTVSDGTGADCLGDPLAAVLWLARTARDLGDPLRAGHVVLSGALGPMSPLAPGAQVTAVIGGLGTVTTAIGEGTV